MGCEYVWRVSHGHLLAAVWMASARLLAPPGTLLYVCAAVQLAPGVVYHLSPPRLVLSCGYTVRTHLLRRRLELGSAASVEHTLHPLGRPSSYRMSIDD